MKRPAPTFTLIAVPEHRTASPPCQTQACLASASLEALQWVDLPGLDALIGRCDEAEAGWTLHTLSRSLVNWPTAADRTLIGISCQAGPRRAFIAVAGLVADPADLGNAHLSILVDPAYRGYGLGGQLLDAIVELALARCFQAVTVRTEHGNLAFIQMAGRRGFVASLRAGAEPLMLQRPLASTLP